VFFCVYDLSDTKLKPLQNQAADGVATARCPMVDEIRMAFIISQNIGVPFSGCLWGMIEAA